MLTKGVETHHFNRILAGKKTCEGRPAEKIAEWGVVKGDRMRFCDSSDVSRQVMVTITELKYFKDFGEAFGQYNTSLVDVSSEAEAVQLYNEFPGYAEMIAGKGPNSIPGATVIEFTIVEATE